MPDDPFLAAIRASPDDSLTRLVYADWLDERDDPRGTFLRLEAAAVDRGESDPGYPQLVARLAELAANIDVRWRAAVCRVHVEAGPPHVSPRRHPLNVPGPFYTCGNCMACEAPEAEAPHLLAPLRDGNLITHFVRQPQTAAEVEAACRAIRVCCVDDLRYGGTDPRIITALGNTPSWCDYLLRDDSPTLIGADSVPPLELSPAELIRRLEAGLAEIREGRQAVARVPVTFYEAFTGERNPPRWYRVFVQGLPRVLFASLFVLVLAYMTLLLVLYDRPMLMLLLVLSLLAGLGALVAYRSHRAGRR